MLILLRDQKKKKKAQTALEDALRASLNYEGRRKIGYQGGYMVRPLYAAGTGALWAAFGRASGDGVERYINTFGVYLPDRSAQLISVEINIPIASANARVAGFIAEDPDTGALYLMHSGKVGGGRQGIGQSAFLAWSQPRTVEVSDGQGGTRHGILVGQIGSPDLTDRLWQYVRHVQDFKNRAAQGEFNTREFQRQKEQFERYRKEFSGRKTGARNGVFDYIAYHGDVVQALYEERTARALAGERVLNTYMIDLLVKTNGSLSEVYEVKTRAGRQPLYTAIGQLLTHAFADGRDVTKYLVLPADDIIGPDLERAIERLEIQLRHFRLKTLGRRGMIELL